MPSTSPRGSADSSTSSRNEADRGFSSSPTKEGPIFTQAKASRFRVVSRFEICDTPLRSILKPSTGRQADILDYCDPRDDVTGSCISGITGAPRKSIRKQTRFRTRRHSPKPFGLQLATPPHSERRGSDFFTSKAGIDDVEKESEAVSTPNERPVCRTNPRYGRRQSASSSTTVDLGEPLSCDTEEAERTDRLVGGEGSHSCSPENNIRASKLFKNSNEKHCTRKRTGRVRFAV